MKPSIGRIVHVLNFQFAPAPALAPAIVVAVDGDRVNVQLFMDGPNSITYIAQLLPEAQADADVICWRWPEIIK
jgi:hypothetical protein